MNYLNKIIIKAQHNTQLIYVGSAILSKMLCLKRLKGGELYV